MVTISIPLCKTCQSSRKGNQFAFNDIFFRKNDQILHLVNDTELNVFNGDIGIITDLIPGKYTEKVKQDEDLCPSMAMKLSILVTNGVRLLGYATSIINPKEVNSQSLSFPSAKSGVMLQQSTSFTPQSHAPE